MRKKKSHRYLLLVMIVLLVCSFTYSFVLAKKDQRKDYEQQQKNSVKHIIGNGQLMTLDKRLTPFTRVSISGDYQLFIKYGKPHLQLTTDANIIPYISMQYIDGQLMIDTKDRYTVQPSVKPKLTIYTHRYDEINFGGNIEIKSPVITTDKFSMSAEGSQLTGKLSIAAKDVHFLVSDFRCDLQVQNSKKVSVLLSGQSAINLSGSTESLGVFSAGGGAFNAKDLHANTVDFNSGGSMTASVFAKKRLKVTGVGDAKITYYGDPEERLIDADTQTLGNVRVVKGR